MTGADVQAAEARRCCVAAYESEWARLLLGDALHPGGLALTLRAGAWLSLGPDTRLLDVASGRGASAIALAREYGCSVHGIDLSEESVAAAKQAAEDAGLSGLVSFAVGDAEKLEAGDGEFDAVLCECAFCTFPGKAEAASEFARVLKPGGRIALSDITRDGELPPELDTLLGWVACLADARPLDEYVSFLGSAGFHGFVQERHDQALTKFVSGVKLKLLGLEVLARVGKAPVPLDEVVQGKQLAKSAAACIRHGQLGYALIGATAPDGSGPCTT